MSGTEQVSEVELRTVPNVRGRADADTFVKDYLASVDDASVKPTRELIERQYTDMLQTAMQRGMRPTGDPKLVASKRVDAGNLLLTYSIPVVVAAPAPETPDVVEKAAVAGEQSATGGSIKPGEGARTADGKTVDTSAPKTPTTGSPAPTNG